MGIRRFLAGITAFALAFGGVMLGASAASADASPAYVIALWKAETPGSVYPQKLVQWKTTDSTSLDQYDSLAPQATCGVLYQVDLYLNDTTTAALIQYGKLDSANNPAESFPGPQHDQYYKTWTKPASDCTPPPPPPTAPTVSVGSATCTTPGGSPDVNGTVNGTAGSTYTVELRRDSATSAVLKSVAVGPTSYTFDFGSVTGGATYYVSAFLTGSPSVASSAVPVAAASCPKLGDFQVAVTPCSTVGGSAAFAITSADFVSGTTYQIVDGSGAPVGAAFQSGPGTYSVPVPAVAAQKSYTGLQLIDVATKAVVGSLGDQTVEPCPTTPTVVSVAPATCSTVGGTSTSVSVTYGGLVPGRTYVPTVDGAAQSSFVPDAGKSEKTIVLTGVAPGSHTFGVHDSVLTTLAASTRATVGSCPTTPTIGATASCSAPGGTAAVTVNLTTLTSGHTYTVTVSTTATPSQVLGTKSVDAGAGTTGLASFTGLPAGATYTVAVTDAAYPAANASKQVAMSACPSVAGVSIECVSSTLSISLSDLNATHGYSVVFTRNGTALPARTFSGMTNTTVSYNPVAAGQSWTVALTDVTTGTPVQTEGPITIDSTCAPGQVDAYSIVAAQLAHTGTDTTPYLAMAAAFVISGAGLIGFAAYRRHKEVRD